MKKSFKIMISLSAAIVLSIAVLIAVLFVAGLLTSPGPWGLLFGIGILSIIATKYIYQWIFKK